jgi:hypothetical protein
MPLDGLADVAEYTAKALIRIGAKSQLKWFLA